MLQVLAVAVADGGGVLKVDGIFFLKDDYG
jgi:hypothetical protein